MSSPAAQITDQPPLIEGGFSYEVSHETLSQVLGLGHSMIGKLRDEGMPTVRHGVYDLRTCVQWYIDKWRRGKPAGDVNEMTTRAQLNLAQKESVELETRKRRGELHPSEGIDPAVQAMAVIVATRLDGMPARTAAALADLSTEPEVRAYLADECRSIREQIAASFVEASAELHKAFELGASAKPRKAAPRKKTTRKKRLAKKAAARKRPELTK